MQLLILHEDKQQLLQWRFEIESFLHETLKLELKNWSQRLINALSQCGLPIGNLTSQFFANVYLNELDQFVKHQLKCKHYVRYVDDFVLLMVPKVFSSIFCAK